MGESERTQAIRYGLLGHVGELVDGSLAVAI